MSAEVRDGVSARERLGLGPDATDAEVRETYRELERFLTPSNVPRRLQEWAARERSAAGRALSAEKAPPPAAPKPAARPRPRPSDLPDFFDEDIRDESPAPRRVKVAPRRPPAARAAAPAARRRRGGLVSWRSATLVLALVIVAAAVAMMSGLLGSPGGATGSGIGGTGSQSTSQADTAVPLDQARVAELTKKVQANPNDTAALFELGEMNFQAEKWQDSIDWFTKLLAIDPTNTHARTDVGTSSYNLQRYDEAKAAWEEVVRRDPNDAQAHSNLAFYYLSGPAPDMNKAIAEWQKVIDVAPDSQLAKNAKTHIDAVKATSSGASSGQTAPTPTAAR